MKVLYGVVGEGMGHATRSSVVLRHLADRHELLVVASGRAHGYLKRFVPDVVEFEGLRLAYEDGAVDRSATFADFVKNLPKRAVRNVKRFREIGKRFAPDVVISDFDSFAYIYGRTHRIPVISIDNMQIINRCALDVEIPAGMKKDYRAAKTIVKAKLPKCYHYLITTFFFPEVGKDRTSLFPPILRPEILDAEVSVGEHILVYQTSTSNEAMLEMLQQFDAPFKVYGYRREEELGNVHLRDFSEDGFVRDLASCRAVLATGGFSLMSEAVYLGKPFLAVPVGKQFEQVLNALYLEKLGYGEYHASMDTDTIRAFLDNSDSYRENLKQHAQDGNSLILAAVDELLAEL